MKKLLGMAVGALVALALVTSSDMAAAVDKKPKNPDLEIQVRPPLWLLTSQRIRHRRAEGRRRRGGLLLPALEWEWGDGGKSVNEGDCDPWEEGVTELQRRFTASHLFKYSGVYRISLRLKRLDRTIAKSTYKLTVRQGAGEQAGLISRGEGVRPR